MRSDDVIKVKLNIKHCTTIMIFDYIRLLQMSGILY